MVSLPILASDLTGLYTIHRGMISVKSEGFDRETRISVRSLRPADEMINQDIKASALRKRRPKSVRQLKADVPELPV